LPQTHQDPEDKTKEITRENSNQQTHQKDIAKEILRENSERLSANGLQTKYGGRDFAFVSLILHSGDSFSAIADFKSKDNVKIRDIVDIISRTELMLGENQFGYIAADKIQITDFVAYVHASSEDDDEEEDEEDDEEGEDNEEQPEEEYKFHFVDLDFENTLFDYQYLRKTISIPLHVWQKEL
jgi:hypothetical protein